jgi:hypothetical protein
MMSRDSKELLYFVVLLGFRVTGHWTVFTGDLQVPAQPTDDVYEGLINSVLIYDATSLLPAKILRN